MNTSEHIGIITPSYNQHGYLSRAVRSVLDQTHHDFTYFIINDYAGKPDSEEKNDELRGMLDAINDKRIVYAQNEENIGIARSRNRAIRACIDAGFQYIFFLDHDDVWNDPEKLTNQLKILAKNDVGILGTQFQIIDDDEQIVGHSRNPLNHADIYQSLALSCPILLSTMGVNTQVFRSIGLLNEQYGGSDDWEFLIRVLERYRGANMSEYSTSYRCFAGNTSQEQWHKLARQHIQILHELGSGLHGTYQALLIEYMKLVIPPKYRSFLRDMKKYIMPAHANFRRDASREKIV